MMYLENEGAVESFPFHPQLIVSLLRETCLNISISFSDFKLKSLLALILFIVDFIAVVCSFGIHYCVLFYLFEKSYFLVRYG